MTKFVAGEAVVIASEYNNIFQDVTACILSDGGWITTWLEYQFNHWTLVQQRFDSTGTESGEAVQFDPILDHEVMALADGGWLIRGTDSAMTPASPVLWRFDANGQLLDDGMDAHFDGIAAVADGGWVCVKLVDIGLGDRELRQQRYDADGNALGTATVVAAGTAGYVSYTDVTALNSGGWVVTWIASDRTYQQRFGSDGTAHSAVAPLGAAFGEDVTDTEVAALSDGGWVTLFWADGQMRMQRYAADGAAAGDLITIDRPGDRDQASGSIEALSGGGWVVAWAQREPQNAPDYASVRAQVYDALGNPVGHPYAIFADSVSDVAVEALDDGSFVVTWDHSYSEAGVEQSIFRAVENTAPVAIDDVVQMKEGLILSIDPTDNDHDADSADTLTVESATLLKGDAKVTINNGHIRVVDYSRYLSPGRSSTLVIEYTMSDGFSTDTGQVRVEVQGRKSDGDVYLGTGGTDSLHGMGYYSESFYGRAGNDTINARDGKDVLVGGSGDDRLGAGYGDDILDGGRGHDVLSGGHGTDRYIFRPGDGRDVIFLSTSHSAGEYAVLDLTAYHFKDIREVQKLAEVDGYNLIIDLPGADHLEIIHGAGRHDLLAAL